MCFYWHLDDKGKKACFDLLLLGNYKKIKLLGHYISSNCIQTICHRWHRFKDPGDIYTIKTDTNLNEKKETFKFNHAKRLFYKTSTKAWVD